VELYDIWTPYNVPARPQSLGFIMTGREDYDIGRGSQSYIQNLLRDIGVDATPVEWSITPYRSSYYSEYDDEDEAWRDRWRLVWCVQVAADRLIDLPRLEELSIGTNARDDSFSQNEAVDDAPTFKCLVVGDFEDEAARDQARSAVGGDDLRDMREQLGVGLPTFTYLEVGDQFYQLQADLGSFPTAFYANGADYAMRVIEIYKSARGITNFQDHLLMM